MRHKLILRPPSSRQNTNKLTTVIRQGYGQKEMYCKQGLSQDLKTGYPKLAIVNFWASTFSREIMIYSDYNHKNVFSYLPQV